MDQHRNKPNSTTSLFHKILNSKDINEFIENNSGDLEVPAFHAFLSDTCASKGLIPEQVIRNSGIERTYGHQLFNGTRNPSREKVIQLAFGLQLDVEGTQKLLQIAQKSLLYPKIKRDAAIIFCINKKKGFFESQSILESLELTLLGDE